MNSAEIDRCMKHRLPVVCDGIRYKRILEYVSWYNDKKERQLSTVLLAEKGNYTMRVLAEKVETAT